MYHCHIKFYLAGQKCRTFEIIKGSSPLEHFTHEFSQSDIINTEEVSKADVIFANLQDMNVEEALRRFEAEMKEGAELILLIDKDDFKLLLNDFGKVKDIWTLPMSDEETGFRFLRWQQAYKQEKDLWQTSQFLETTINNMPLLVWYKDKNGIHEKVNDSFCLTVRKPREDVEGRSHAYIWNVETDDPDCIKSENEVMSKKKTFISEETIMTGRGTRTLSTYKSPLYDVDGSVMGTVGVAIDVTRERDYEKELTQRNKALETIFSTLDCGLIQHTLDGKNILRINRAALKILGYESQEEMLGDGFEMVAETVLDEDKPKLRKAMKSLLKVGDSVSVEYRVRHKDGELLHVMSNIRLFVQNGEVIYQRFLLDCTAQKLQEKKNERHYIEWLQALSIDYSIVCFFDLETGRGGTLEKNMTEENPFASASSGKLSFEKSVEDYIRKYVYEDDQDMFRSAVSVSRIKEELSAKKIYYTNYRAYTGEKIKYFQMKIVRAGVWGGNSGIVIGIRNVDEETRNEMEQKNLLEDALMQANRASKAKSTFLSNMSHDIRTPMNAIVGFTNLAISHIDNREQVEEYLKKIMTSGNHLLSLINDILDMSHIESGKIHLEEKECSLSEILKGLKNILQADINAKQLELQLDTVDVVDEEIYCDKLRLNQVLLNLLSNAVKYTPAGGTINMRITEKAGAPEGYANYEFNIKDNGIGMSEEFISHIFEPFEREKNSTTSGIQGTGLGMAITKNIVDMMNGNISVKSEQGAGSEFTVSFTFRLYSGANEVQEIPPLKNKRVLVVDDDFNTCDSVSYMLGQLGLRAEWTLSGKEAILRTRQSITRQDKYSLYVIDWVMPDMNGIEVARRIKKEIGGNVPIIIMTAYDWTDVETEAKEAGVTAFCSKPLFMSELRNCLMSIVNPDSSYGGNVIKKAERLRTGRILLAEDVELNQEIAAAILKDAGFETDIADNGGTAVKMLKESEPGYYNLVLMDVQMPVMNGYEATKEIRNLENKELASIPIIAMTANAFEEDKREALDCGMNGHIAKPIDIDKLLETLDKIMD